MINLSRFCTDDGPGIRTTVFLKGCPLTCAWCHNPESQRREAEILFTAEKCTRCGRCAAVCPEGCHTVTEQGHTFDRTGCTACGLCAKQCPTMALEQKGTPVTAQEVFEEVKRDLPFYGETGGVTVSGGEPLDHPAFTAELLRLCKEAGIHTAVETSGFGSEAAWEAVLPHCDLVLFDIKETDEKHHLDFTGVPLAPILEHLRRVDEAGVKTHLRAPIIPGWNDREEHLQSIRKLADTLQHCQGVEVMPYHAMGAYKYDCLGRTYRCADVPEPDKETVAHWRQLAE